MTNNSKEIEEAEKAAAPEKQDLLNLNADDADRGAITLSKNCIARIVSKTAAGIEGFARFAPKGAGDILNIWQSTSTTVSICRASSRNSRQGSPTRLPRLPAPRSGGLTSM